MTPFTCHQKWDLLISQQEGCDEHWYLPLGAGCGLLHGRVEEGVAEEVQGAAENHSGVVSGLEASDQQGVLADSMGVLVGSESFPMINPVWQQFVLEDNHDTAWAGHGNRQKPSDTLLSRYYIVQFCFMIIHILFAYILCDIDIWCLWIQYHQAKHCNIKLNWYLPLPLSRIHC